MPEPPEPEPRGRRAGGPPPPVTTLRGGGWGDGRGKRILVADDESHVVRLVEVNLQQAGYEVMKAYDGREAFEAERCARAQGRARSWAASIQRGGAATAKRRILEQATVAVATGLAI